MERSNVSTVLVAGQVRKWQGQVIGFDLAKQRRDVEASRDYVFAKVGIEQDLFRA